MADCGRGFIARNGCLGDILIPVILLMASPSAGAQAAGQESAGPCGGAFVDFCGVVESQRFDLDEGSGEDSGFGNSVAMSGDVAVVGARLKDLDGAVYVYRLRGSSWHFEQKLVPTDGAPRQHFGGDVATDGHRIAVSAPRNGSSNQGAVFVFRRDGNEWVEEQRVVPRGQVPDEYFGMKVALDGKVLAVSGFDPTSGFRSHVTHAFRQVGHSWIQEARFSGSFYSHHVQGKDLIVSATDLEFYRHDGSNWVEVQRIPEAGDRIACDGSTLVVQGSNRLHLYRLEDGQWIEDQTLNFRSPGDMAILGDRLVVEDAGGDSREPGKVVLFQRFESEWHRSLEYVHRNEFPSTNLGATLAMNDHWTLAGNQSERPYGLAVFFYPHYELGLEVLTSFNDQEVVAGELNTIRLCGGERCSDAVITLTDVSGIPWNEVIHADRFDGNGEMETRWRVPSELRGATLTFCAAGFLPDGRWGVSNPETVLVVPDHHHRGVATESD